MKTPTPTELDALEAAATRWQGTPFVANGATCQAGVCCHRFVHCLYLEAGWMPATVAVPDGPPAWSMAHTRSLLVEWIEASALFAPVALATQQPGDLLTFQWGAAEHHAGILLRGGTIAHAMPGHGAIVTQHLSAQWAKRLRHAWRLV